MEKKTTKDNQQIDKAQIVIILLMIAISLSFIAIWNKKSDLAEVFSKEMLVDVRQNKLDVARSMGKVKINPIPYFTDGSARGDLRIANEEDNLYAYTITIIRDDTGEVIYKSGLLDPGYYIKNAALQVELPKGDYVSTAYFEAYKADENTSVGIAVKKIVIRVLT